LDAGHRHAVQPDRIGPVGRTRGKDSRQRIAWILSRAHLEHIALALVQPRQQDDGIALLDAIETPHELGVDLD